MSATDVTRDGSWRLGPLRSDWEQALADLVAGDAVRRLWDRDHTLWQDDPTEVADRLGWLDAPVDALGFVEEINAFAEEVKADGLTHAVVCGMGGSSLFPELVAKAFDHLPGSLDLRILDSTHPGEVERVTRDVPLNKTLFIIASKSGTTVETRSMLAWFRSKISRGDRYVAITDEGTELAKLAADEGFRRVFTPRADIGGRFSALTEFGLVPAALMGVDIVKLIERADQMGQACRPGERVADNPAARLAAFMAAGVRTHRDKLTFNLPPALSGLGDWLEQLIAESTGKQGTGVIPVVSEHMGVPDVYSLDRLFVAMGAAPTTRLDELVRQSHPVVHLPLEDPYDIGAHVMRWEIATALTGFLLGINPFDQPDVASAKAATNAVLEAGVPELGHYDLEELFEVVQPGHYIVLTVFADPGRNVAGLQKLENKLKDVVDVLRSRYKVPVTVGFGPRYLHSTGQLHKGGPNTCIVAQVFDPPSSQPPIPGKDFDFATLVAAQAAGDLQALHDAERRAARVTLQDLLALAP